MRKKERKKDRQAHLSFFLSFLRAEGGRKEGRKAKEEGEDGKKAREEREDGRQGRRCGRKKKDLKVKLQERSTEAWKAGTEVSKAMWTEDRKVWGGGHEDGKGRKGGHEGRGLYHSLLLL